MTNTVRRQGRRICAAASAVAVAVAMAGAASGTTATAAGGADGDPSTFIALYQKGASTQHAARAVKRAGGELVANYRRIGVVVARSGHDGFAAELAAARGVQGVASTEGLGTPIVQDHETVRNGVSATADDTAEPLFGLQWDMRQIHTPEAHQITLGSRDVVVGILDSGIDADHPDLAANFDGSLSAGCNSGAPDTDPASYLPTTSGHGTHVAGTVAADDNGIGVIGVAPDVRVASVKVVNDEGFIFPEAAVCGFMWAGNHGFDVTNNSYFIDPWLFNCRNEPEQRVIWKAVTRAIKYSQRHGVLNVAAQGNYNQDLAHTNTDVISPDTEPDPEPRTVTNACVSLPVEVPGVVGVTATGPDSEKTYYSSYGIGVADVTAPGGTVPEDQETDSGVPPYIVSTYPDDDYAYLIGTSMASPHAVGVAALIASQHPGYGPNRIARTLERTADPIACPDGTYEPIEGSEATCQGGRANNGFYGHGEVDALAAVSR